MIRIILISLLTGFLITGCSCSKEAEITEQAHSRGINDAKQLIEDVGSMNRIQLERRILEIRNVENEYRDNGHNSAADSYIEDFSNYLRENNDSLATAILGE